MGQENGPGLLRVLRWSMLAVAALFFLLHFVHPNADFPSDSPWNDWSKYTDEGWYGDAAIRHFVNGHWYVPGDFNPAIAMPVLPLLEAVVFRFTGVSLAAVRTLSVVFFGLMLVALYRLIQRGDAPDEPRRATIAAPLTVLLLCTSPFVYAFERLAILEPLLGMLTVCAMLAALPSRWRPGISFRQAVRRRALSLIGVAFLLVAMVLTKPTAVALLPAVLWICWRSSGERFGVRWRATVPVALLALAVWLVYYLLFVQPRFLEDYRYIFAANAYTGFQLEPLAHVLFNTVADGCWMGTVLYVAFIAAMLLLALTRPRFFDRSLVQALLLWIGGYFVLLAYHNNLQPRYYLLLAVPVTALTAMGLEECVKAISQSPRVRRLAGVGCVALCVVAIVVPDAWQQMEFVLHPTYTYLDAARQIARIVRANRVQPQLLLSVSGSDLTLMTGLPSIDDDFGTLDLDDRVKLYRPGWYVAWNEIDDDKMDALQPLFHPVRVAAFAALEDPDRNLLILYRLDPAGKATVNVPKRRRIPRPLRTRIGQQPAVSQLQH